MKDINDILILDLQNLPILSTDDGEVDLSIYNLNPDSVTDNSDNFNALIGHSVIKTIMSNQGLILRFSSNVNHKQNSVTDNSSDYYYLFKNTISSISYDLVYKLKIIVDADIIFDFSEISDCPTKDEIENSTASVEHHGFIFSGYHTIEFAGGILRSDDSAVRRHVIIDGGGQSLLINNTYYEGLTKYDSSGEPTIVYSSFGNNVLYVASVNVILNGILFKNSMHGVQLGAVNFDINNCSFIDSLGDNGLSLVANANFISKIDTFGGVVDSCYFKGCQDLGLTVQCRNIIVTNCTAENCGNNNNPLSDSYGVNSSFNTGGAFGCENSLIYKDDNDFANVMFINCTAINCYNYAFYSDTNHVLVIGCIIQNIISSWDATYASLDMSTIENSNKYMAVHIRGFGVLSWNIIAIGCVFDNINDINYSNGNVECYNCNIKNVNYSAGLTATNNVRFVNCSFDDTFKSDSPLIGAANGKSVGTSSERPSNPNNGTVYLDTTLGHPIFAFNNGEKQIWISPTGQIV